MSKGSSFEVEGLEEWRRWLKSLPAGEIEAMIDRILRSMALRGIEYLQDFTPVRTGEAARSYTMGSKKVAVRGTSFVRVGSRLPYVGYLNDGHQQRKGQFVPGEWKSGQFHYRPEAYPKGMVLTGKYVEGVHMFEKMLQHMDDDMQRIILFELKRLRATLRG